MLELQSRIKTEVETSDLTSMLLGLNGRGNEKDDHQERGQKKNSYQYTEIIWIKVGGAGRISKGFVGSTAHRGHDFISVWYDSNVLQVITT